MHCEPWRPGAVASKRQNRAARAEVRDTRVCVSLLLGTVDAEADCRCLEWWRLLAFLFGVSFLDLIALDCVLRKGTQSNW